MKRYKVTQIYHGGRDFQNIRAESRDEAIEEAKSMLESEDWTNEWGDSEWFAEVDEEDEDE